MGNIWDNISQSWTKVLAYSTDTHGFNFTHPTVNCKNWHTKILSLLPCQSFILLSQNSKAGILNKLILIYLYACAFSQLQKTEVYLFSFQYISSITNQGNKQKPKPKEKLLFKQLFLKEIISKQNSWFTGLLKKYICYSSLSKYSNFFFLDRFCYSFVWWF